MGRARNSAIAVSVATDSADSFGALLGGRRGSGRAEDPTAVLEPAQRVGHLLTRCRYTDKERLLLAAERGLGTYTLGLQIHAEEVCPHHYRGLRLAAQDELKAIFPGADEDLEVIYAQERARLHVYAAVCALLAVQSLNAEEFAQLTGSARTLLGADCELLAREPMLNALDAEAASRLSQALALLERAGEQEFAEEHDPDGIWGLSETGKGMLARAEELLRMTDREAAGQRALRRLRDFWREYREQDYATERAIALLDEAREELRAALPTSLRTQTVADAPPFPASA